MSIDQRQFEQLSEMGIKLWQRRNISDHSGITNSDNNSNNTYQIVDLTLLAKSQCFKDILQAFDLTLAEINQQSDHLDLGLINWYFIENENADEVETTYSNNKLVTPTINLISHSVKLKKQLWQTISQHI